jgi:glucose-6-phosphate dehydrogenase assembly protein OpcA
LPFALRRLLIGDLPTNLWWAVARPPAMGGTLLFELAEVADQVIYDRCGWPEPARGLAATSTWLERFERPPARGRRRRIGSDLTWRRLRPWRRLVAEALDPSTAPGALETIDEIIVDHGPNSVTSAWSLSSWLVTHLEWRVTGVRVQPGIDISWGLISPRGPCSVQIRRVADAPRGIRCMRISCQISGRLSALVLSTVGDRRLQIEVEGVDSAPRTVTLSSSTPTELIARQLSDREWDPEFRRAMVEAQSLASSVLRCG